MKERPILFSAPMVRALLDVRKTMTRRVVKPQPDFLGSMTDDTAPFKTLDYGLHRQIPCPYGQPGDRLWVREAWRTVTGADDIPPRNLMNVEQFTTYEADEPKPSGMGKLRPSMFMPHWASRITLEITGVRVERLQDISEADARAEGARNLDVASGRETLEPHSRQGSCVAHYKHIWQEINGPGSWDLNPWVWVIEFKRVQP